MGTSLSTGCQGQAFELTTMVNNGCNFSLQHKFTILKHCHRQAYITLQAFKKGLHQACYRVKNFNLLNLKLVTRAIQKCLVLKVLQKIVSKKEFERIEAENVVRVTMHLISLHAI